jgi:DNA-binding phage protein
LVAPDGQRNRFGNVAGDIGKAMLRDYINATITFPELARRLGKSSKSIHRMFGRGGNPGMDSIVGVLRVLQQEEKVRLTVKTA